MLRPKNRDNKELKRGVSTVPVDVHPATSNSGFPRKQSDIIPQPTVSHKEDTHLTGENEATAEFQGRGEGQGKDNKNNE